MNRANICQLIRNAIRWASVGLLFFRLFPGREEEEHHNQKNKNKNKSKKKKKKKKRKKKEQERNCRCRIDYWLKPRADADWRRGPARRGRRAVTSPAASGDQYDSRASH